LFDGVNVSVNRNLITSAAARELYQDLVMLPTEVDIAMDPRVIGFMGDAGSKVYTPSSSADVLSKFHSLIQQHDAQQDDVWNQAESAIVRVEYLYNGTFSLVPYIMLWIELVK
jgi:hypothetical protein